MIQRYFYTFLFLVSYISTSESAEPYLPSAEISSNGDSENLSYAIVDTGQTDYFDNFGFVITSPSAGEALYGQDAQYTDNPAAYQDNGDGTVTDLNTGLIWQQVPPAAFYTWAEAKAYGESLELAGYDDWRLPTIKEQFSLADFNGSSRTGVPYLDADTFTIYDPPTIDSSKRDIDGQFWSSNGYVGTTMFGDLSAFGFNFIDGRIKSYPTGEGDGPTATAFVRCVRGSSDYGKNNFIDNGDGTITDLATGLMWMQDDSGVTLDWQEALAYSEDLTYAGYDDWHLPDAKELQSIVDYTRAPDAAALESQTAAIDPIFSLTETESWFWSSTSLGDDNFAYGVYVCFGRALSVLESNGEQVNAHGAGAMRSDPKFDDGTDWSAGNGPQSDEVRIYNYARAVRREFYFNNIIPSIDSFQGELIDGFPGWKSSPWYKNYNVDFWPWIYHDEHGWQFVFDGSTEEVIFVWDWGLREWLFFNESTYRWMFMFGANAGWIWTFSDNTTDRRFFQRLDDGSILSVPAGISNGVNVQK